MFIDTHAHIYSEEFIDDLELMISNAHTHGITDIYMPNIDSSSIARMLWIQDNFEGCHATIGLHPCYVKENYKDELKTMENWLGKASFVGVGEIGIDLYWDKTYVDAQYEAFSFQISMAKDAGLPIIIHSRESLDLTIQAVSDLQDGRLKGIFHCFNGNLDQAKKIIDLGFYMGIGGVITYKNAGVDKVVEALTVDHLVLETDAPYLTPVPHRGKRNESAYISIIAQKIAEIKSCKIEEIASATTFNAKMIFGDTPK